MLSELVMADPYQPNQSEPFKFSRSKLELFTQCPYCFYLDQRIGVKRPDTPGYTLNNAVDALLKKECDGYRLQKQHHPIATAYKLNAVPYLPNPAEKIDAWRNNKQGIAYLHALTNFHVYGIIDDVWINPNGELIIIDYKATSKNGDIVLDQEYHDAYRRQLDIYAWLFKMNRYPVHDKAYWIYCNGIKDVETFGNCLHFQTVLLEHPVDTTWVEEKLIEAHQCLNEPELPKRSQKCSYCDYLNKVELTTPKKDK